MSQIFDDDEPLVFEMAIEFGRIDLCTNCELPPDHFIHTCRFTNCRTPHDFCDYKPPVEVWGRKVEASDG